MKIVKTIDPMKATSIKFDLAMKWKSKGYKKKDGRYIIKQEDVDEDLFRDIIYIEGTHYYIQGKQYSEENIQDNFDKWSENYNLEHGNYYSYLKTKFFNWLKK